MDNLFDSSVSPTSRHNRTTSVYGSIQESNPNTPTGNKGALLSSANRLSTISHVSPMSTNSNINNSKGGISSSSNDDIDFAPTKVIIERIDNDDDDDDEYEYDYDDNRKGGNDNDNLDKDQYLIDVDIDVDGVMMDGLDQVQYYKRAAGFFNDDEGDQVDDVIIDDQGNIYDDGMGPKYTTEPLSRMLDALALEGLD